jgi:hypothetical protein
MVLAQQEDSFNFIDALEYLKKDKYRQLTTICYLSGWILLLAVSVKAENLEIKVFEAVNNENKSELPIISVMDLNNCVFYSSLEKTKKIYEGLVSKIC